MRETGAPIIHSLARAGPEEEGIGVPGRAVRNAPAILTEREDRTVGSDDGVFREPKSKEFFEKVFHVIGSVRVDRKGTVTGNASNAVTQQRNAQVHVLQNFAAGFRSQARTTTGSASIAGVLHPTED